MYFDFVYYRKVLAFVWKQKEWPGRNRALVKLLLLTPLLSLTQAVFFLLDYVFFPALWRQQVKDPVFIVGHARSGTTLMHRLLAGGGQRFSYFIYWELFVPALTQKAIVRGIGLLDNKFFGNALENRLRAWDDKTFGPHRHIHEQGLWIPEEDQFVMIGAFVSQQWAVEIPNMQEIDIFHIDKLSPQRRKRWMNHYKECVKRQLLRNGGNKIHLSKNPSMSGWVNALFDTFPDAKIIVMVRDPIQCIPSALRMMEGAWRYKKWSEPLIKESLAAMTRISFDSFTFPVKALAGRPESSYCFVDYRDLTSKPKETLQAVYAKLEWTMSDQFTDYLTSQQDRERKHVSKFKYDLKNYAVTATQIETELDDLYQQYGWPRPSEQAAIENVKDEPVPEQSTTPDQPTTTAEE